MARPRFSLRVSRDTILFVFGLLGLAYETIIDNAEKPTLIIAFVGMLGLPLFIRNDEHKNDHVEGTRDDEKVS